LTGWADRLAAVATASGGALALREILPTGQVNVRAIAAARAAAGAALGIELPARPNTTTSAGDAVALWLGPDEWLVLDGRQPYPEDDLQDGWSLVNVCAQRTMVAVTGPATLDLLAHGCPLDLARLGPRWCAQTTVARANVVLWSNRPDEIRILVLASFARYLAAWLLDAATEWTTGTGR
jgi:sarcosine oxidase subunit gamma